MVGVGVDSLVGEEALRVVRVVLEAHRTLLHLRLGFADGLAHLPGDEQRECLAAVAQFCGSRSEDACPVFESLCRPVSLRGSGGIEGAADVGVTQRGVGRKRLTCCRIDGGDLGQGTRLHGVDVGWGAVIEPSRTGLAKVLCCPPGTKTAVAASCQRA